MKLAGIARHLGSTKAYAGSFITMKEYSSGINYFDYSLLHSNNPVAEPWINSAFLAGVLWVTGAFCEADPVVRSRKMGSDPFDDMHPVVELLNYPNPFYDGFTLMMGYFLSRYSSGNAFIYKQRDAFNQVVGLWYLPHHRIRVNTTDKYLNSYVYMNPDGTETVISPMSMIHGRVGLDPNRPHMGLNPTRAIDVDLKTDYEGGRSAERFMTNMGMMVPVISPEGDVSIDATEAKILEDRYMEKTTGLNRGKPVILSLKSKVTMVGPKPSDLDLTALRRAATTRICSCMNIDPLVLSLEGEQSTYTNKEEARIAAYESVIKPLWKQTGMLFTQQLFDGDFGDKQKEYLWYDQRRISALAETRQKDALVAATLYEKGVADRAKALRMIDEPYTSEDTGFYSPRVAEQSDSAFNTATQINKTRNKTFDDRATVNGGFQGR